MKEVSVRGGMVKVAAEPTGPKYPAIPPVTFIVRSGDAVTQTYLTVDEAREIATDILRVADGIEVPGASEG